MAKRTIKKVNAYIKGEITTFELPDDIDVKDIKEFDYDTLYLEEGKKITLTEINCDEEYWDDGELPTGWGKENDTLEISDESNKESTIIDYEGNIIKPGA